MAAPGERRVTEDQIRAWKGSGHPCKLIAAAVAEWAAGKERGTVLPDDGFFGIEASGRTCKRAKTFLVAQGLLEADDAHYVALPARARTTPGRSSTRDDQPRTAQRRRVPARGRRRAGTRPGERTRVGAASQAAAGRAATRAAGAGRPGDPAAGQGRPGQALSRDVSAFGHG
jgi:hypothetical protein